MILIRPPISNDSIAITEPLGTVPNILVSIDITITLMFNSISIF